MNTNTSKATRHQAVFIGALREFSRASNDILRQHEITPKQYQALLAIGTAESDKYLSMNDLAATLDVRHNSAVGLINRLEAAGLVRRQRTPTDRRVASLSLTERGTETLEKLSDAHNAGLKRIAPAIHGATAATI